MTNNTIKTFLFLTVVLGSCVHTTYVGYKNLRKTQGLERQIKSLQDQRSIQLLEASDSIQNAIGLLQSPGLSNETRAWATGVVETRLGSDFDLTMTLQALGQLKYLDYQDLEFLEDVALRIISSRLTEARGDVITPDNLRDLRSQKLASYNI